MNIAFVPVRGGSKSIPLKNIKILNGKPLVYWVALAAQNSKCIDKIVIATDCSKIKETVLNFKFDKLFVYDRNPKNAQDTSSTESVMIEYINNTILSSKDNIFLIQATSPLLTSEHIDNMFKFYKNSGADSIFSAVREKQFHWIETENGVEPINYDYKNRPRRQDYNGILAENGACYINTVGNIIKNKCRISGKIMAYELPPETMYEIDDETDWLIVENIMQHVNLVD